jgi:hypothetical protein
MRCTRFAPSLSPIRRDVIAIDRRARLSLMEMLAREGRHMAIKRSSTFAVLVVSVLLVGATAAEAAGALAVGTCGVYGFGNDFKHLADATGAALTQCSGKCRVVLTALRRCAAFAVDAKNVCGPHGWASAARLGQAQNLALRQCYQHGGRECVIRAFLCDAKG